MFKGSSVERCRRVGRCGEQQEVKPTSTVQPKPLVPNELLQWPPRPQPAAYPQPAAMTTLTWASSRSFEDTELRSGLWQTEHVKHQIKCNTSKLSRCSSGRRFSTDLALARLLRGPQIRLRTHLSRPAIQKLFLPTSRQENSGERAVSNETFSNGTFFEHCALSPHLLSQTHVVAYLRVSKCPCLKQSLSNLIAHWYVLVQPHPVQHLYQCVICHIQRGEPALVGVDIKATASVRHNDPSFIHEFQAETVHHSQHINYIIAPSARRVCSLPFLLLLSNVFRAPHQHQTVILANVYILVATCLNIFMFNKRSSEDSFVLMVSKNPSRRGGTAAIGAMAPTDHQ